MKPSTYYRTKKWPNLKFYCTISGKWLCLAFLCIKVGQRLIVNKSEQRSFTWFFFLNCVSSFKPFGGCVMVQFNLLKKSINFKWLSRWSKQWVCTSMWDSMWKISHHWMLDCRHSSMPKVCLWHTHTICSFPPHFRFGFAVSFSFSRKWLCTRCVSECREKVSKIHKVLVNHLYCVRFICVCDWIVLFNLFHFDRTNRYVDVASVVWIAATVWYNIDVGMVRAFYRCHHSRSHVCDVHDIGNHILCVLLLLHCRHVRTHRSDCAIDFIGFQRLRTKKIQCTPMQNVRWTVCGKDSENHRNSSGN